MLPRSGDIRDQSLKWPKIDRNVECFWPPNFFSGSTPNFWTWIIKIQPVFEHVAKFHGDRPRELRERVAKQKTPAAKHKPVRNCRFGRPTNVVIFCFCTCCSLRPIGEMKLTRVSAGALWARIKLMVTRPLRRGLLLGIPASMFSNTWLLKLRFWCDRFLSMLPSYWIF